MPFPNRYHSIGRRAGEEKYTPSDRRWRARSHGPAGRYALHDGRHMLCRCRAVVLRIEKRVGHRILDPGSTHYGPSWDPPLKNTIHSRRECRPMTNAEVQRFEDWWRDYTKAFS